MGDPRRQKKKYVIPKRPFDSDRFEQELQQIGLYGLRNKKELWKHRTELSRYRRTARNLLAQSEEERERVERELTQMLVRRGILKKEPNLDNVLDLTLEDLLERRLQTIVFRMGLACSMHHARQLVTHGHISLNAARVMTPSRIITLQEEENIQYTPKSPLNDASHPARVAASEVAQRVVSEPSESEEQDIDREPRANDDEVDEE
jgi:small subunit ribosomal protein S4